MLNVTIVIFNNMTDKEIKQAKQTIDRIKEGYPLEKYQGYKHHAEHTKDCDALFLVMIIEKYDLLHSVSKCCDVCDAPLTSPAKYYDCSNCAEIVQGNDC